MEGGLLNMNKDKIELTQEDMEMGKYIYSILLSQPTTLMSWGFQRPQVIELGLKFFVSGFKHKGWIQIKYNAGADLFDVYLLDTDDSIKEMIEGVYFDQLVDIIDNHVELVDNYNERVYQEYNSINYEEGSINNEE